MDTNCMPRSCKYSVVLRHFSINIRSDTGNRPIQRKLARKYKKIKIFFQDLLVLKNSNVFFSSKIRIYLTTTLFAVMWLFSFVLSQCEDLLIAFHAVATIQFWICSMLVTGICIVVFAVYIPKTTRKSYDDINARLRGLEGIDRWWWMLYNLILFIFKLINDFLWPVQIFNEIIKVLKIKNEYIEFYHWIATLNFQYFCQNSIEYVLLIKYNFF